MGYVYLLKSNKKDTLKIGKTTNLEQRMKSFNSCSKHLGTEDEIFEFLKKSEYLLNIVSLNFFIISFIESIFRLLLCIFSRG